MTRDFDNLHRRPFLTPIWLTVLAAFWFVVALAVVAWVWGTANSTMIIVVRHAEKAAAVGDPPLSVAGEARAESLARMLGNESVYGRIDAIYTSSALRNRMTAAPLAAKMGIVPTVVAASDARSLVRRIFREHGGGRVLVVGHSDTVPDIVKSLSGVDGLPAMTDAEYGTMYIVCVPRLGHANYLRLIY